MKKLFMVAMVCMSMRMNASCVSGTQGIQKFMDQTQALMDVHTALELQNSAVLDNKNAEWQNFIGQVLVGDNWQTKIIEKSKRCSWDTDMLDALRIYKSRSIAKIVKAADENNKADITAWVRQHYQPGTFRFIETTQMVHCDESEILKPIVNQKS